MKLRHSILVATIIFTQSQHGFASEKSLKKYNTGVTPRSYGNCQTIKDQVVSAFTDAAGVQIISSQCDENSRGTNVEITYALPDARTLTFTSTRDLQGQSDISGRGYMATQKECEARKDQITDLFKENTGLIPFFVRCMQDDMVNQTDHMWHVAIDAIGVGNMSYQYIDRLMSQGLASDPVIFLNAIRDYFNSRPETTLVDAVYRLDTLTFGRIDIALFAKNRVSVSTIEGPSTKKANDCASEAEELRLAGIRAGIGFIASACKHVSMTGPMTFALVEGRGELYFDSTGITFETMDTCKSMRSKTFEDMRQAVGDDVVGIICSDSVGKPTAYIVQKAHAE